MIGRAKESDMPVLMKDMKELMKQKCGESRGGREKGRHPYLIPSSESKVMAAQKKKFRNHQYNHNESEVLFHPSNQKPEYTGDLDCAGEPYDQIDILE